MEKEKDPVILFYSAHNNRPAAMVEQQLSEFETVGCRSFEAMDRRLRKPCHGLEVVLVLVVDPQEMVFVEKIHSLLCDLRLVLILPGRDAGMVSQAHRLSPRFIAYVDQDLDQIGAVIKRMMGAKRLGLPAPPKVLAESACFS
ncbi:MAG: hypothetical protein PVJ84_12540 [Desulfobacteraceae bacterium]